MIWLLLIAAAATVWAWKSGRLRVSWVDRPPAMPEEEARVLLDLPRGADRAAIQAAHRRLIARVHPDAGGSAELTRRVNAARDTMLSHLNPNPPRAS
jgi:hypothetical protein